MDNTIYITLSRRTGPAHLDVVQGATAPNIAFILADFEPASGATARLYVKKPTTETYNEANLDGNIATLSPTTHTFDEEGRCAAQLEVVTDNKIAYSWPIHVDVAPNLINGSEIEAQDDFTALQQAIMDVGDITELKTQVNKNTEDIANLDTFNSAINVAGNVNLTNKDRALYGLDSTGTAYPFIKDNGQNLWIGAGATAVRHHVGATYISAGYSSTNASGNKTIQISVPNATNTNATNYGVFHENYLNLSKATDGILPVAYGGTGIKNFGSVLAGSINGGTTIGAKSLPSSTSIQNVGTITLPAGKILCMIYADFTSNATGYRALLFSTSSETGGAAYNWLRDYRAAVNGGITTCRIVCTLSQSASTTWYLNAVQNSGSTLTVTPRVCWLALGNV